MYTSLLRLPKLPLPVALSAALAFGVWAGAAAPQTSTTSTAKKKKTTVAAKSPLKPAPKSASAAATKSKSKRPVTVVRHPQQPSPDRIKEIQQALASKGYFKTEPDGNWGPSSIDALKRFQHDQNLQEDGKIGSLSLIALGLGPKRETSIESEQKTP